MTIDTRPSIRWMLRSKEKAKKNYDRSSKYYNLLAGGCEKPLVSHDFKLQDLKPGERAFEIGFGTGDAILSRANTVRESSRVFGMDISEGRFHV